MELFESQSQEDLFPVQESADHRQVPLADRMRPQDFDEFVGQEDVLANGQPLRVAIEQDRVPSLILWGPPGTGKTTLANLIAKKTQATYVPFSAVLSGAGVARTTQDCSTSQEDVRTRYAPLCG